MSTAPNNAAQRPALRVALAGIGVVGGGVVRLLEANRDLISRRAGRPVEIVALSARDRTKDRGFDLSAYRWVDDMSELTDSDDVDVIVEMIGGSDGPALSLARKALGSGKALVTANKAMLAHHGLDLARLAEEKDTALKYEAAVAGGIPVIKAIREGTTANEISRVYGILNGTCNYILTLMEREGASFADALAAAQAQGYAEADSTFDVEGIDAAHKLSILASLCFGTKLDFGGVSTSGIRNLIADDIREAEALGHRVRLLGLAERDERGLYQRVQPCLVPSDHPLAYVPGALNAVVTEGNPVGRLFFEGAGAGAGPTASAIVADIIDIARDEYGPAFAMPVDALVSAPIADAGSRVGKHYVRFVVQDRIGVLADIATAMRDADVSIESFIQRGHESSGGVVIVMVTHEGPASAIQTALAQIESGDYVVSPAMMMPILAL